MPTPTYGDIAATTLKLRTGMLADNMTKNNAILYRLNSKGKMKPADGGEYIVQELNYAENGTYTRYDGYEQLNITPSQTFTYAEFAWKQAAVAVTISGLEMIKNSGSSQVINLLESRIENAESTMANKMSEDLYSTGAADGGKQIGGLQLIVADTGLSTVGGISSTDFTWWQNYVFDFSTSGLVAGYATIEQAMNTVYLNTSRGRDHPDLILTDNTYFNYYWQSLQAIQRIEKTDMAQAGFRALKFMDSDVVFDGGYGGQAPSNHMYFLNTDYIFWRPHPTRNMAPLNPDRFSVNQDALVKLIAFAGNMTCSNRFLQGVMVA